MFKIYDISGEWNLILDEKKCPFSDISFDCCDTISLPSTTSFAKKGVQNDTRETGFLTDTYKFEGYAWFQKNISVSFGKGDTVRLFLERTRHSFLWVNGRFVGDCMSLSANHIYDITDFVENGSNDICIMVSNVDYPTAGGHMTSPDTQTNWNGITGSMEIRVYKQIYINSLKVYPDVKNKKAIVKAEIINNFADKSANLVLSAASFSIDNEKQNICIPKIFGLNLRTGTNYVNVEYDMGDDVLLWSEFSPVCYRLSAVIENDKSETVFGMRDFSADKRNFLINGKPTFLRGKHDGMIFPLTGFAPTDVESWIKVFKTAKEYGINHYRFHTCCPPEAAFYAADLMGIYMQPEINFWGTLCGVNDEGYNEKEQSFLIAEGERILDTFGNHPSFCMMSLGNELWGDKNRMAEIIRKYKAIDNRHLYTQGSNNFQWYPVILEEDDFFSGVRFTKGRQIRGSYAMCDEPLGFVQTQKPSAMVNFNNNIIPVSGESEKVTSSTVEIQYGTGTKVVEVEQSDGELIPNIPVISHEVGQYETFPDFSEIDKYTGSIKARNFEVFKERLEEKGMLDLDKKFFMASGKLAVECYKTEIEAALRTSCLAGFQLLDIQDFSGQGTALVGILDAFMDNKGTVSAEEWRSFCNDAVILAEFKDYVTSSDEEFSANVKIFWYRNFEPVSGKLKWSVGGSDGIFAEGVADIPKDIYQLCDICTVNVKMPHISKPQKYTFRLETDDLFKEYTLWSYPNIKTSLSDVKFKKNNVCAYIETDIFKALKLLEKGERVLFMPNEIKQKIEGFYCTDFWCYPMFRSISESMNKKIPVGTMGLLIDSSHPALNDFPCEFYSTPQWYEIVSHADCAILDDTQKDFRPIVQMIDNFERNHKLGILFEAAVGKGKLLVCTSRLMEVIDCPEVRQFAESVLNYVVSEDFAPTNTISESVLKKIF